MVAAASWLLAPSRPAIRVVGPRSVAAPINELMDESRVGQPGRVVCGAPDAAIRIVAFVDYQCAACMRLDRELRRLVREQVDVSLSIRHFPWCSKCNPAMEESSCPHPLACLAASAVATVGLVGDQAAYARLHEFFVERGGDFDREDVRQAVDRLGFELEAMDSDFGDAARSLVAADVGAGLRLGVASTPTAFVNGIKIGQPTTAAAVQEAVTTARTRKSGDSKSVSDLQTSSSADRWRRAPEVAIPAPRYAWPPGAMADRVADRPHENAIRVSIWGDYQDADTRVLDRIVRRIASRRGDVLVEFRHLPRDERSHELARVVEAAALLGGEAGFWALHLWIMQRQGRVAPDDLDRLLASLELDASKFRELLASDEVQANIANDVALAADLSGAGSPPILYIGGRFIPDWRRSPEQIVESLIAVAKAESDAN